MKNNIVSIVVERMEKIKICMISTTGGYDEQIKSISELESQHYVFLVTEKTKYASKANYYLPQTGLKDKMFPIKMIYNFIKTIKIWIKEKPELIITTGTMVA